MKPKTKPLRSLYFQFIQGTEFEDQISTEHVAKILSDLGYIELLINKYDGITVSHYQETEVMQSLPKESFEETIAEAIAEGLQEGANNVRSQ